MLVVELEALALLVLLPPPPSTVCPTRPHPFPSELPTVTYRTFSRSEFDRPWPDVGVDGTPLGEEGDTRTDVTFLETRRCSYLNRWNGVGGMGQGQRAMTSEKSVSRQKRK